MVKFCFALFSEHLLEVYKDTGLGNSVVFNSVDIQWGKNVGEYMLYCKLVLIKKMNKRCGRETFQCMVVTNREKHRN